MQSSDIVYWFLYFLGFNYPHTYVNLILFLQYNSLIFLILQLQILTMRHTTLLLLLAILFFSCNKEDTTNAEADDATIREYLAENNIDAVKDESGLYYLITQQGSGNYPSVYSKITIKYKGYFTDGTVFDETGNSPYTNYLSSLIRGWQIGIPLFKPGGKGTLFVPSNLGYGSSGSNSIPGDTVIIFDIELIEFE